MKEFRAKTKGQKCRCPYCEYTMEMPMPFCGDCGAELYFCSECGEPMPKQSSVCPQCGAEAGRQGEGD